MSLWNLPQFALLLVALLGWFGVTCALKVLAMRCYHAVETHDRVRESRRLRAEYVRLLAEHGRSQ